MNFINRINQFRNQLNNIQSKTINYWVNRNYNVGYELEHLIFDLFKSKGFKVIWSRVHKESGELIGDGGIDLIVFSNSRVNFRYIIQCKNYISENSILLPRTLQNFEKTVESLFGCNSKVKYKKIIIMNDKSKRDNFITINNNKSQYPNFNETDFLGNNLYIYDINDIDKLLNEMEIDFDKFNYNIDTLFN